MWLPTASRSLGALLLSFLCLASVRATAIDDDGLVLPLAPLPDASESAELKQLYKDNLEADLAPWQAKGRLLPTDVLAQAVSFSQRLHWPQVHKQHMQLVVIRNGRWYGAWLDDGHAGPRATDYGRTGSLSKTIMNIDGFEDTIFLMNVYDFPACARNGCTTAPVFSLLKSWGPTDNTRDKDILLPMTNHVYDALTYPWEKKKEQAVFRGGSYCLSNSLGRWALARLSAKGVAELDVAMTGWSERPEFQILAKGLKKADSMNLTDHARWKYVISADGCSASTRFTKLLLTNSVVVKERSPYIEYFYRSIKDGVHYVSYKNVRNARAKDLQAALVTDATDVVKVVRELKADDARARRIAVAGQMFARKALQAQARAAYIREAFRRYNTMFGGLMPGFVASLNVTSSADVARLLDAFRSAHPKLRHERPATAKPAVAVRPRTTHKRMKARRRQQS